MCQKKKKLSFLDECAEFGSRMVDKCHEKNGRLFVMFAGKKGEPFQSRVSVAGNGEDISEYFQRLFSKDDEEGKDFASMLLLGLMGAALTNDYLFGVMDAVYDELKKLRLKVNEKRASQG